MITQTLEDVTVHHPTVQPLLEHLGLAADDVVELHIHLPNWKGIHVTAHTHADLPDWITPTGDQVPLETEQWTLLDAAEQAPVLQLLADRT